ncbi:hypothetical protein L2E82_47361 [Cichorium intybus]|uniref:Uncharacterized protein n=1 Tax=Cichorium intybus TaxID=13427 RepID=A0ACB8YVC5_CICIN|nr:hypothetical protein L2E82_47361 [Cichorium intybus]
MNGKTTPILNQIRSSKVSGEKRGERGFHQSFQDGVFIGHLWCGGGGAIVVGFSKMQLSEMNTSPLSPPESPFVETRNLRKKRSSREASCEATDHLPAMTCSPWVKLGG